MTTQQHLSTAPLLTLLLSLMSCAPNTVFPDIHEGEWDLVYGAPMDSSLCSSQATGQLPTRLEGDIGHDAYDSSVRLNLDIEGVTTDLLTLGCEERPISPDHSGGGWFNCLADVPGGWTPNESLDARWPVELVLEAQFTHELQCLPPLDDDDRFDWVKFDRGEFTLTVTGPCEGLDCPSDTWSDGPACVRGDTLTGEWYGCADEDVDGQCVEIGAAVDCPLL